jgi:hypothetical protein
LLIF